METKEVIIKVGISSEDSIIIEKALSFIGKGKEYILISESDDIYEEFLEDEFLGAVPFIVERGDRVYSLLFSDDNKAFAFKEIGDSPSFIISLKEFIS